MTAGGVGRVLREFCNLVDKLSIGFKKFSNLLFQCSDSLATLFQLSFKLRDGLDIELFFFRKSILVLKPWLLSGERGPPLEQKEILFV